MRRLLTALLVLPVLAGHAAADDKMRDVMAVAQAVDGYIRPETRSFADVTGTLDAAIAAFCKAPGPDARKPVDAAFRTAVEGWSAVQILRFGPLTEANRLERIAYWPDPKGIGLRQIRRALAARDPSMTDPAQLGDKSVALQGLTALEYLLYAGEDEAIGTARPAGTFRCAYAAAAAHALAGVAGDIAREWAAPDGFAERLMQPGSEDPLYRTPSEAMQELHRALGTGLQVTQDQKLKPVLGEDMNSAKPFVAPFRRSGLTMAVLAADARALKEFVAKTGFTKSLPNEFAWLDNSMAFEFDNAVTAAEAVTLPIDEAVYDKAARGKLEYLFVVLGHLRDMVQTDLATALDLKVGFNALDGD